MEPCERSCKALGGVVPEFQRNINDFVLSGQQLAAGKREPSVSDVLSHRHSAYHGEYSLIVKRRHIHHPRYIRDVCRIREVFLDKIYRALKAFYLIHCLSLLPSAYIIARFSEKGVTFCARLCHLSEALKIRMYFTPCYPKTGYLYYTILV